MSDHLLQWKSAFFMLSEISCISVCASCSITFLGAATCNSLDILGQLSCVIYPTQFCDPQAAVVQLHDFQFLLSVPHAVCISSQALHKDTHLCRFCRKRASPIMLFSQHFLVCVCNVVQQMNTEIIRLVWKLKREVCQCCLDDNETKR